MTRSTQGTKQMYKMIFVTRVGSQLQSYPNHLRSFQDAVSAQTLAYH